MIGKRLAHYEILELLGKGGMGEVYRARDTRLDREVAVKVLPPGLSDNATRLARLEREAKAIAALSHPNVLAVFEFGIDQGHAFVVTELLEGETLRDRLGEGALPPRKVTEYGRQIARGLAAAHDRGIVHRDLKPENLFVTGEGRIKILDFGLATAAGGDGGGIDATVELATRTRLTSPGTVLGTVDYMAPEQVRGEPTDARSDLFSCGSILYEMLTGTRPFHRETGAETMAAILKDEPVDLTTLAPGAPPALAAIIQRCLEKREGERFHSAHDLAFSLEALSGSSAHSGPAPAIETAGGRRRRAGPLTAIVLAMAGIAVGAAAAWFLRPAAEDHPVPSFTRLTARRGTVTGARFTPGAGAAVYSAAWDGGPARLYPATPGSRTANALDLPPADLLSISSSGEMAVSLDRRHTVGWEAIGTLAVIQPGGTAPRPVLENVMTADWSPDGKKLAVAHEVDGVVRLEYPVGKVLYESPGWISDIRVNPDGRRVLIADCPGRGDNLAIMRIVHPDGRVETVPHGASWGAMWAPDGESILCSSGGRVSRIRPGEDPVLLAEMTQSLRLLDRAPGRRMLVAAASNRREMIGLAPGETSERDLSWEAWTTPRLLSADGRLAIFEEGDDFDSTGYAIYLRRTDGSPPVLLGRGSAIALSPDAASLAVLERPFLDDGRLVLLPTGPGEPRPVDLQGLSPIIRRGTWLASSDGGPGSLVVAARAGDGPVRLYELPLDGAAPPHAITPDGFPLGTGGAIVSADGRRMVVRPPDGAAVEFDRDGSGPRPIPVLRPGDSPLQFDRDGRHLYVEADRTLPARIFKVDLETGARSLWREIAPRDPAGVFAVDYVLISRDGGAYVYSIRRVLSGLVLVEGLD